MKYLIIILIILGCSTKPDKNHPEINIHDKICEHHYLYKECVMMWANFEEGPECKKTIKLLNFLKHEMFVIEILSDCEEIFPLKQRPTEFENCIDVKLKQNFCD